MNKFEKIYLDLESKIKDGTYPIGKLIPTEHDLADQYKVSRETIRKAQRLLLENGFIHKTQGRGSVVLDFHRFSFPISGLVSYKELQAEQNIQSKTSIIQNDIIDAPDFLVGTNGVVEGEKFIHLIRTRSIQNEVMIIDEDYIRCSVVENIPNDVAENSIYEYFEKKLGLDISYASKEFSAEKVDDLVAYYMKLSPMNYVIDVKGHVFLENTMFFQYTVAHHRLEKFRFQEFARRRTKLSK